MHIVCTRAVIGAISLLLSGTPTLGQARVQQAGDIAPLIDSLGTYSRKISTQSELAQKFFDQGLRLIYGYYIPEAVASFQEALRHDRDNPMIYWGLALAISPNPNSRKNGLREDTTGAGREAIATARAHAGNASPIERALIEALSVRYDLARYPNRAERDDAYIAASRSVLDRFPDDLDAGYLLADAIMTSHAWLYWNHDGSPLPGTREAQAALEHVMALNPRHPGAVHLFIHLLESSAEPQRALPQADRLASLMPNAGHMVHMPAHIYVRVGQYEKAIASNLRSIAVDSIVRAAWGTHAYPAVGTLPNSARTHAGHSWDFLRLASTLQGNYARAVEAERASGVASPSMTGPMMGAAYRRVATLWLVEKIFGKWDVILAEPAPPSGSSYLDGMWHYVRASAFAARGELQRAESERGALRKAAYDSAMRGLLVFANPQSRILALALQAVDGEIALARGRPDSAVRLLQAAVAMEDSLAVNEPPDWVPSMRLALGRALLAAHRPREAESTYREDLVANQENGWALFGLWRSLRDQGKQREAATVRERFERAWKNADVSLPSLSAR
jgi:tetratricopeptide (TPR) repeat protein